MSYGAIQQKESWRPLASYGAERVNNDNTTYLGILSPLLSKNILTFGFYNSKIDGFNFHRDIVHGSEREPE